MVFRDLGFLGLGDLEVLACALLGSLVPVPPLGICSVSTMSAPSVVVPIEARLPLRLPSDRRVSDDGFSALFLIRESGVTFNELELSLLGKGTPSSSSSESLTNRASSADIDLRLCFCRIPGSLERSLLNKSTFPVMEIRIALGPASDLQRFGAESFRFPSAPSNLATAIVLRPPFRRSLDLEFLRMGLTESKLLSSSDESRE